MTLETVNGEKVLWCVNALMPWTSLEFEAAHPLLKPTIKADASPEGSIGFLVVFDDLERAITFRDEFHPGYGITTMLVQLTEKPANAHEALSPRYAAAYDAVSSHGLIDELHGKEAQ